MIELRRPALLLALGLAACQPTTAPPVEPSPVPAVRPPQPAREAGPSDDSRSAALFYARLQKRLLDQGLLRQDGGGPDATFGAGELARNFERIALFSEYIQVGGRYVAQQNRAQLRRWERPVRIQLHFGESVPPETQRADRLRIQTYVGRLRRITGHPISVVGSNGNYHVFVASVDEQRDLGPAIAAVEPALSRSTIREITSLDRSTYCAVYASSSSERPNSYVSAIAFVRSEHPDLFRQSCYHEEIAQGLGLANDSPAARPSIFNDDEEFALLTRHDELLLRMLYDDRLNVGMSAEEARPIIQRIAVELIGPPGPV
ncbi:DUF2927 domain-containing protein [Jannaschia sp. S6380]|uniref:DUF2927 domain-containing protein n=1 Tax=Jannaschia sp. S6380 TaxID=2926408 RepID=UPI001FF3532F|nr:DUF2927 domain-containing protein [Jannaschia sp. S6380]MCK0165988.1 DUF2927 domain-containing protein [Jannaschia sp. S6380]